MFNSVLLALFVAATTGIVAVSVGKSYIGWDTRFLDWFSKIAQDPRWFIVWMLVLVAWIPLREMLVEHDIWFRGDGDLILMTILWSVVPFMVENAMKYSMSKQMNYIETIIEAIKYQTSEAEERDELLFELVGKLLDAVEEKD